LQVFINYAILGKADLNGEVYVEQQYEALEDCVYLVRPDGLSVFYRCAEDASRGSRGVVQGDDLMGHMLSSQCSSPHGAGAIIGEDGRCVRVLCDGG
jgi:hypothetical protein